MFLALSLASALAQRPSPLVVTNLQSGGTVRTPVVLVRGEAPEGTVMLNGVAYPAVGGAFAGAVELKPGSNTVTVAQGRTQTRLRLRYVPMRNDHRVRIVYLLARDEVPYYIGQEAQLDKGETTDLVRAAEADIRARAGTMGRMIQAFAADALHDGGYARKSFDLDEDRRGNVIVDFLRVGQTGEELRRLDGDALYALFEPMLKARYDERKIKVLAIMGATRYDAATQKSTAHTALGGGSLALFGSGPMRFWPASIADIPHAFLDARKVDPKVEFDDSGLRQRAWANVATTYGACLHELGHAFGLPHSPDRRCIMSRGFDQINRAWILREPKEGEAEKPVDPESRSHWDPAWAARLDLSPWFQPDGAIPPVGPEPTIQVSGKRATFTGSDLRLVSEWIEGLAFGVTFAQTEPAKGSGQTLDLEPFLAKLKPGDKLHLIATDRFGRFTDVVANP